MDLNKLVVEHDPIEVPNAGLALTSPFLPQFFSRLEMLEPDDNGRKRWHNPRAASRAVHLLQYLVDGKPSNSGNPEPPLVLNKVLCGLPSTTPIEPGFEPTEQEQQVSDQLLKALIANWHAISNTSVAALRETFLQRVGRLQREDSNWRLAVQRKTLDVLVDKVPWNFSAISHEWMEQPVYVTW